MSQLPYKAVIFDMDGVLTPTAQLHKQSWKQLFNAYLEQQQGKGFTPFQDEDYSQYAAGKLRYEVVRDFLQSRQLHPAEGSPTDGPEQDTVYGLGKRKNEYFQQLLTEQGVEAYPDALEMIRHWQQQQLPLAVVSSSLNAPQVLKEAGITDCFQVQIDGVVAAERGLPGKPQPDTFLAASQELGIPPRDILLIEDAIAGVKAARAGGFGWVIGIARQPEEAEGLRQAGAHLVIHSLTEIKKYMQQYPQARNVQELPHALERKDEIRQKLAQRTPVLFLDYDGTLSHIVKDPDKALLTDEMKDVLSRLAQKATVAVISGRDRADVQQKVGLQEVVYAGSHGFDIQGPNGLELQYEGGLKAQPALDKANQNLKSNLGHIHGVRIERKKYAIAVHYRNVADEQVPQVMAAVEQELARQEGLKGGGGKKIMELKPALDWHKGRATEWLLNKLYPNSTQILPIFMGDDLTDEDGLKAIHERGIGILAGEHGEKTWAHYRLEDVEEVRQFLEELYRMIPDKKQ